MVLCRDLPGSSVYAPEEFTLVSSKFPRSFLEGVLKGHHFPQLRRHFFHTHTKVLGLLACVIHTPLTTAPRMLCSGLVLCGVVSRNVNERMIHEFTVFRRMNNGNICCRTQIVVFRTCHTLGASAPLWTMCSQLYSCTGAASNSADTSTVTPANCTTAQARWIESACVLANKRLCVLGSGIKR